MGAWGFRNFQNDDAQDWLLDFHDDQSLEFIEETFQTVLDEEKFIEVDLGLSALAAAEVVAAIHGKPSRDFPTQDELNIPDLDLEQFQGDMTDEHRKNARLVVEKIYLAPISELRELWADSDSFDDWLAAQKGLLKRLS